MASFVVSDELPNRHTGGSTLVYLVSKGSAGFSSWTANREKAQRFKTRTLAKRAAKNHPSCRILEREEE